MEQPEKSIVRAGMRNILLLGLVSFFADISSEMVYPLIPIYLTAAFGATPALVGVVEGIAESVASLLKVGSGYLGDRFTRKKPLAFCGYATGLIYKLALLLAGSWTGILAARVVDRIGKGVRTAPRDLMVAQNADTAHMGRAFGLHKALDMAGSAIGILLAWLLLREVGGDGCKTVFALSVIPILFALAALLFVRENGEAHASGMKCADFRADLRMLDGRLKLYLLVAFLFTLGNSSNTFLLLRAMDIGFSTGDVILLYLVYNVSAALFAIPLGKSSDRIGRKRMLVCGYCIFTLVYLCFAFAGQKWIMVVAFAAYGIYTAMVSGTERAFIAEIAPESVRGTMLGLHGTLVGVALLPASLIAGLLWETIGAYAPFLLGALLSLGAAAVLQIGIRRRT